jgi:hypothetical protein
VSVEELPSHIHVLSASTKPITPRVPLLRRVYWPRKRKHLLILNRTRQVLPVRRSRVRDPKHSNPRQDLLRLSQERILVKLTAKLAEGKGTTLVIALAAPRESPFFPRTNHFDHSWLSRLSRPLRHKLRFESWRLTISPSVTIA